MNIESIKSLLGEIIEPNLNKGLQEAGFIKNIQLDGEDCKVELEFHFPAQTSHEALKQTISESLKKNGVEKVDVSITTKVISHSVQQGVDTLKNVKNTIAVASGKGGVGKSTTSINLALALQAEGARVGILDADIYGPSQPRMLGVAGKPEAIGENAVAPKVSFGIQSMSIGYLIEEDTPMIWRGPMVTGALEQLLRDTQWEELDYLIIDLPPGTGDIQLTLSQKIPVSAALIVTTPQDIALLDAKKALKMFEKVKVPVLGIIENMSTHICSQCGHEEHIFGSGGGEQMAKQYDVELLGSLPLDIKIREGVDNGRPTVAMEPDGDIAEAYKAIARKSAAKLSQKAKDYTSVFPKIVIENN